MSTPSTPDSELVLARARRTYLVAMALGPVVLVALSVVSLVGRRAGGNVMGDVGFVAFAVVFALVGYVVRNRPQRWNRIAAISGGVAGVYGAIGVLAWRGEDGKLLIAGAVLVVLAFVPWLAVRNASAAVLARPKGDLVATGAELSFALRDEADGWFLIRRDEIALRIRRKRRRDFDDNEDEAAWFSAITEIEVVDLPGGEEFEFGIACSLTPSAGPALRVLIDDKPIHRQHEWIVPIDDAWQAAEALRARMAQAPSK